MRRHSNRLLIPVLVTLLLISAPARAAVARTVGLLGDLARVDLRGATVITAAQLRDGLLEDRTFQLASTPTAPLDDFLAVTQRQLTLGYQRAGFIAPKVEVAVSGDAKSLVINVVEGRRFTAGDITVAGAGAIDPKRLIAYLIKGDHPARFPVKANDVGAEVATWGEPEKARPSVWEPGTPAPLDPPAVDRLTRDVRAGLLRQGFFRAKFRVDVDTTGERALLFIRVADPGPRAVIGTIDVRGANRNAPKDVLALIGVAEGTPVDFAMLQDIQQKLWGSARFWKHSLSLTQEPGDPPRAKLTIDLDEHAKVTPLNKPLTANETAVLRCRDWVDRSIGAGSDLVIEADEAGARGKAIVNARGGWLIRFDTTAAAAAAAATKPAAPASPTGLLVGQNVAIYVTRRRAGLQDLLAGRRFEWEPRADMAGFSAFIRWVPNLDAAEKTRQMLFIGGSVTSNPTPEADRAGGGLELLLAPVCALDELYRPDGAAAKADAHITDGVFELTLGKATARFEAETGKLIELRVRTDEGQTFRAAIEAGAIDRELAALDAAGGGAGGDGGGAARPKPGMIETFAALATHAVFMTPTVTAAGDARRVKAGEAAMQKLITRPIAALAAQWREPDNTFYVPVDRSVPQGPPPGALAMFAEALPWVDQVSARGSWPWTLARESLLVASGRAKFTHLEAGRMFNSPDVGPVGCLAISRAYVLAKDPVSARLFAKRGLDQLTFERFAKDCDALCAGDSLQARLLREVLSSLRDLSDEELDSLAVVLGPRGSAALKEIAKLERAAPEDKKAATIAPALQKTLWESGMREVIANALTDLSQSK